MIYVVIRERTEEKSRTACVVKAENKEDALKMVGVDTESHDWTGFTDGELTAIINTKEGYVSGDM